MKIVLLAEAQRCFEAEDEWWCEHRDARDLFLEEFALALEQIRSMPEVGQRYRRLGAKLIRRLLYAQGRLSRLLLP